MTAANFFTPGYPKGAIVTVIGGSGVGKSVNYIKMQKGTFHQLKMGSMNDAKRFVLYNLENDGFFIGDGLNIHSIDVIVEWSDFCLDTQWWADRQFMLDTFYEYNLIENKLRYEYRAEDINKWLMVPVTPLLEDVNEELAIVDWDEAITVGEFILEYSEV